MLWRNIRNASEAIFAKSSQRIIEGSTLKKKIFEAQEDDDHGALAILLRQLVDENPDHEDLRSMEIEALRKCHDWTNADSRALAAIQTRPESIRLASLYAWNARLIFDWQEAIFRFAGLREKFDPKVHLSSAQTVLHEFACHREMCDEAGARNLLADQFDNLLSHAASLYPSRDELVDFADLVPHQRVSEFLDWLGKESPGSQNEEYATRVSEGIKNRRWIESNCPDVRIVSLGQNCLPWIVPNRWGLRPGAVTLSPFGPFDLLGMANDVVAECLETNFSLLLEPGNLSSILHPGKIPTLLARSGNVSFFHERGPWWARNDWERVHTEYRRRIANFRAGVRSQKRLYIYCICSNVNINRIINGYFTHLDHHNSRMLIINVLKENFDINLTCREKIKYAHIPYPENYNWIAAAEFDSERGSLFEKQIASSIKNELMKFL